MKTASWSLALVAAAGTVRATEEDCPESSVPAYPAASSSWAAPSYGAASSSSAAPVPSGSAFPSCWSTCFAENGSPSEAELCGNDAVSKCIHDTCSSEEDKAYWAWYNSYCSAPASSSAAPSYPAASSSSVSPASVSSGADGYPSGAPTGPVIVTNTVTNTKYVCPCETPTRTPGEVYTTVTVTEWTSTLSDTGAEATYSWGDYTSIYTSYQVSTITDTVTDTCTEPIPESTGGAVGQSDGPGGYPSGSAPGGYPTGSAPGGYPSGSPSGYPSSGPGGYPSESPSKPVHYPSSTLGTGYPSGTSTGGCIPCEGQPGNNPEEWCGYTIHDNWYDVTPKTCKTVEYWWTITAETVSPDGVPRLGMIVNGQLPGPKIEANWGDEVIVHFTNGMTEDFKNGTSLHFHGIRQNGTNEMDGVSSITQCPIAPGQSMTYKWTASSYGSSWWHSHYALQTYEGVFGPMTIHGPAAMEYDDEITVLAQDWNHETVNSLYYPSQVVGSPSSGPQTLDTGLINGMNVWEGSGQRFEWTISSGKSYRIRLVNTAIQSTFVFYVDGHKFSVIAMDFVPITPYETDKVVINIGQRYDLILKADQTPGDYWMRADNQQPCGQLKNLDIKGIVHYAEGPNATPDINTPPLQYTETCLDEPMASLVPIVPWSAGSQDQTITEDVVIAPQNGNPNLFKWTLSGTTFYAEWENPTLQSILDDGTVPDTSGNLAIEVPNLGEWVYVIIETPIPLPHPIHLHGHDFLILAQGLGTYDESVALQLTNPPRRDVANIPADPSTGQAGYLVVAFYTSNPGVWLMHCHIGWVSFSGYVLIIQSLTRRSTTLWASLFRLSRISRVLKARSSTRIPSMQPAMPGQHTQMRTMSSPRLITIRVSKRKKRCERPVSPADNNITQKTSFTAYLAFFSCISKSIISPWAT